MLPPRLSTRLTAAFGIDVPIISAPMAFAAGGALAAAVSHGGGLGLIGCGYGDPAWITTQFDAAGDARIGCGFITWSIADRRDVLALALDRRPVAVFLSFGDPAPLAGMILDAGAHLICQVQTLDDARRALDCGADMLVAQGAEAGGHGERRATMTLVPEVADLLARRSPDTLLCAAGGIADGRGLAACLMLGADGVVIGSRFWATPEALVHPAMHRAALAADGDGTIRSSVMDIVRRRAWPKRFTARVLRNRFTERWHGNEAGLAGHVDELAPAWEAAWNSGDVSIANTFIGEDVGLIDAIEPASALLHRIASDAAALLAAPPGLAGQAKAGRPLSAA